MYKSKSQKAIHSLKLSVKFAEILLAITTPKPGGRRRAYPAHDAAMDIMKMLIAPRITSGKKLHAVTRPMVQELGDHTDKSAKNAIIILRSNDVLRLVKRSEATRDPETGNITRGPHLYELNPKYIEKTTPRNQDEAIEAILQHGGSNQDFLEALATCELMGLKRASGEAIIRAFEEKKRIIKRRQTAAAAKGRAVVPRIPSNHPELQKALDDLRKQRERFEQAEKDGE